MCRIMCFDPQMGHWELSFIDQRLSCCTAVGPQAGGGSSSPEDAAQAAAGGAVAREDVQVASSGCKQS